MLLQDKDIQEMSHQSGTQNKVGGGLPTPVKEKVSRIEKTISLLQGKPTPKGARKRKSRTSPGPGQEKIEKFFHKLAKSNEIKNKGVSNDSLLGVPGHSAPQIPSKEGTGLDTVECGGYKESKDKKRIVKVLERWPHPSANAKSGNGPGARRQKGAGSRESPGRKWQEK